MILENKLGITNQAELASQEEKISKSQAKKLFDSGDINQAEIGTFSSLSFIHAFLFADIYHFAGKIREVNIAKGNFRFVSVVYLQTALEKIDQIQQNNFEQIVEQYVEMNIAHPFREGNGRATRIWLDLIFKQELKQVIDWNKIEKQDYLSTMERSPVNDLEIKTLLKTALTSNINDRDLFMTNIDISYYYEGYSEFKTQDL